MDQNDQRDYAEEAANRSIDRDENNQIPRITVDQGNDLMSRANMTHYIDDTDVEDLFHDGRTIYLCTPGNIVFAIDIANIRDLLNRI